MLDLAILGADCVTPSGVEQLDIGVLDGKIVALRQGLQHISAKRHINAAGLVAFPGVMDTQVHLREPGLEYKEDLATGSEAAVAGGVTGVFEMPNTSPATVTKEAVEDKLRRAAGRMFCHYAFYAGATGEATQRLDELERLPGCCGVKIFMGSSTGSLLVEDDEALERVLLQLNRRCAVHSEDESRLRERKYLAEEAANPAAHPVWRDEETALRSTRRLLRLARKHNKRIHVLHVTTAEEMELLAANKDIASVECLPQHLYFSADDYAELGTRLQMNPPVRAARHREALQRAVAEGVVDVIGSDHAPHTLAEKAKPYPSSPSGMPGVQTLLPVLLDLHAQGLLSLNRIADLTSGSPARLFGLVSKGRLARGYDADITLADPSASVLVKDEEMRSRCGWTPWHGKTLRGRATHTVINGDIVMEEGTILGAPSGKPYRFMS